MEVIPGPRGPPGPPGVLVLEEFDRTLELLRGTKLQLFYFLKRWTAPIGLLLNFK